MTQVTASIATAPIPAASVQHMARLIAQMPISGLRLLDAGCGAGDFLRLALEEGADAHGFEVSETALARATSAGLDPARLKLARGDILPYGDDSFDIVCFVFSFHHVPGDMRRHTLSEVARILRPGGTLACFEPRPRGDMTEVIKLIEDETTVRTEAQALLADPPAPFTRHAAQDYTLTRRFADIDDLLRTVVSVDPARAENAAKPDVQREIRTRFDRYGQPQPDGAIHLEQPAGFYLLRRT